MYFIRNLVVLFFSLVSFQLYAFVQCSSDIGRATINELYKEQGSNGDNFIEIKLLDNTIPSSTYSNWKLNVCYESGNGNNKTNTCDEINISEMTDQFPWVFGENLINRDYFDFQNGFDVALIDDAGAFIDYIQIDNYSGQNYNNECTFAHVYDVPNSITNGTVLLLRKPDGTGQWKEFKNTTQQANTPGSGNDGEIPATPITEYRFDESSYDGSTDEVVDSIGGFHGQANGGLTTANEFPAIAGNPGTCGYGVFDGIDDYVEIADDPRLDLDNELTITVWINPKSLPQSGQQTTIISKDNNFELHLKSEGQIRWWGGQSSFNTPNGIITPENWYHIAFTYKEGHQTIYVNGVDKATRNHTFDLNVNNKDLQIGSDYTTQDNRLRFFHGSIDEVRIYNKALSGSEINDIYNETHPCDIVAVDHFEINHDGQGLTCDAENITIKACADAACSSLVSDATDVQLSINGTFDKAVTVSDGSTDTSFAYTNIGTATLSLDQTYDCKNGGSSSCDVVFADAGFRFLYGAAESTSIGNQVSGNTFLDVVKLQAVENVNGVCAGLFTGNKDVELSQRNIDPVGISGLSFKVNGAAGTSIDRFPTYTPNITLNFGADSKATIPFPVYLDAGQIRLQAQYNVGGVNIVGSSNDFWVSPFKLVASAQSGGSDLNGNSNTSITKHKSGQAFDFTVTAVNSLGATTLNYTPNDMQLLLTRTGPSLGGFDGSFYYGTGAITSALTPTYQSVTLAAFSGGFSSTNSAYYSEVGLLNLNLQDINYGYSGNTIAGVAIDVGRFYPSYFDVTVTDNSFENACSLDIPSFTYVGQPFSYLNAPLLTITAKNALGVTTQNYTETSFQKLTAVDVSRTFPLSDTVKDGFDNATKMVVEPTIFTGDLSKLSNGVLDYDFSTSDTFTYSKNSNSQVAEFSVNYDILINSITDPDGVGINADTTLPITVQPTGGLQRFGRLVLGNSFGSETSSIAQYFEVEYLNTSGKFVRNNNDNCSLITSDAANWSFSNPTSNVTINGVSISGTDNSLNGGKFQGISLSSGNNQGTIDIEYTTQDWLKYNWSGKVSNLHNENASATATFGVYRGNDRIISWREVGN